MTISISTLKRRIVKTLICMIIIITTSISTFAAEPTDISEHWAKDTIQTSINYGLARGYLDGTF
jgi:hypothetical protein